MSLADSLSAAALRLLDAYGEPVTYTTYVQGAYSPATGTVTQTATTVTVNAVQAESMVRQQDGSVIRFDAALYVRGLASRPTSGDRIVIRGQGYRVTPVDTYTVQGVDIVHLVGCTRG